MAVLQCFTGVLLAAIAACADIDYTDQDNWGGKCNLEASKKQSPIDVVTPDTCQRIGDYIIKLPDSADSVSVTNADKEYTVQFDIDSTDIKFTVPGKESTEGTALQLHLHWGASDAEGSEHTLDGSQHAAEMHMVTKYMDGSATKYAAIGRLFKQGDEVNTEIGKMITAMKEAKGAAGRNIADLDISALYPSTIEKAFAYEGSLTTPTCDEVVFHVVIPELLTLSSDQLAELRSLQLGDDPSTGSAVTRNWRDIQDLNDRTIYCYSSAMSFIMSPLLLAVSLIYML